MKCTENVLKALWQQTQQQTIAALNAMEAKKTHKTKIDKNTLLQCCLKRSTNQCSVHYF